MASPNIIDLKVDRGWCDEPWMNLRPIVVGLTKSFITKPKTLSTAMQWLPSKNSTESLPSLVQICQKVGSKPWVGNLFPTADRFQPGNILQTGPKWNDERLAHANLLQLVSHRDTDSVRDMGLLCCNKMLRPLRIMVFNGTRSVFLVSVVPVTFGLIWLWFRTVQ